MQQRERQELAKEVVEMGEQLFALALEGKVARIQDETENTGNEERQEQPFPLEEIEAASGEFFVALRLLLLL